MGTFVVVRVKAAMDLRTHACMLRAAEELDDMEEYQSLLREPTEDVLQVMSGSSLASSVDLMAVGGMLIHGYGNTEVIELPRNHGEHEALRKRLFVPSGAPVYRELEYPGGARRALHRRKLR